MQFNISDKDFLQVIKITSAQKKVNKRLINENMVTTTGNINTLSKYDREKQKYIQVSHILLNLFIVTYNGRMRQFVILDMKGITTWKRDVVEHRGKRNFFGGFLANISFSFFRNSFHLFFS